MDESSAAGDDVLAVLQREANHTLLALDSTVSRAADTSDNTDNVQTLAELPSDTATQHILPRALQELLGEHLDSEHGLGGTVRPPLSAAQREAMLAHYCAAYVSTLDEETRDHVQTRLSIDLTLSLNQLFRTAYKKLQFHESCEESVVAIVRYRLHTEYPEYVSGGIAAISARPPAIYTSECYPAALAIRLCRLVGLPDSCLRRVPTKRDSSATYSEDSDNPGTTDEEGATGVCVNHAMDVDALELMLTEDSAVESQCRPFLVITHAGSRPLCHADDVTRVAELCRKHAVWCHVNGPYLSLLPCVAGHVMSRDASDDARAEPVRHPPLSMLENVNSISVELSQWLALPTLSSAQYLTMFSSTEAEDTPVSSHPPATLSLCSISHTMPLWTAIMSMGRSGIIERMRQIFDICADIERLLLPIENIHVLSCPANVTEARDIAGVLTDSVQQLTFTDMMASTTCCVVFRYHNPACRAETHYLDNLNSWLVQIMQRDLPGFGVQAVDVDDVGLCLRMSPLIGCTYDLTSLSFDQWADSVKEQVDIMNATVLKRRQFHSLAAQMASLSAVSLENWAGLGAVRYIPAHLVSLVHDQQSLSDTGKDEVNRLNTQLIDKLRSNDSAFSLGECDDGVVCIRFGMVTMDIELEDLLSLICELGSGIEEHTRYLQQMGEIVIKNIEVASADLKREQQQQLWQQGVLRHVPLVSTLVSWWSAGEDQPGSPAAATVSAGVDTDPLDPIMRGRRLDLNQGVLESTEETYRLKSQARTISRTDSNSDFHQSHNTQEQQ